MDIKKGENIFYIGEDEKNNHAKITFLIEDGVIIIDHTFVGEEYKGQGVAAKLVDKIIEFAREEKLKLKATCTYAKKRLEENEHIKDIYES